MSEPAGLKLCPDCGSILPLSGPHECVPREKRINLSLTYDESGFLAWCQAFMCAYLAQNEPLAIAAYTQAHEYAVRLKAAGINALGDRHLLLAKAEWPELKEVEMHFDQGKKGVSQ